MRSDSEDLYQVCDYENQKDAGLKALPLISKTSEIDWPSQIMRSALVKLINRFLNDYVMN